MKRKIYIFEEISGKNLGLVVWHVFLKQPVLFFRLNAEIANKPRIKILLEQKQIQLVDFEFKRHYFDGQADIEAFENLEKIYPAFIKRNSSLNQLRFLYKNDDIKLVFKMILMKKLTRFYYLNLNMGEISERFANEEGPIFFIPVKSLPIYQMTDNDIPDYFYFKKICEQVGARVENHPKVHFLIPGIVLGFFKDFLCRGICAAKALVLFIFLNFKSTTKSAPKQFFRYGFTIISPRQFENEVKSVDFLIDDESIKKSDVIFIPYAPLNSEQRAYMEKKGLNFVDPSSVYAKDLVNRTGPHFRGLLLNIFSADLDSVEESLRLIFYFVKSGSLAQEVEIKNLISQNTDSVSQAVARDCLFKNQGSMIWKYMDSVGLVNYSFLKIDFLKAKELIFIYLYCDHLVSWSEDNNEAFKTTRSSVGKYWALGCFWAEHARLIEEGKIKSELRAAIAQQGYKKGMKIVGVFDSSYNDHCKNTYQDGALFLEGIMQLLKDFPDIFIILKEKKIRNNIFKESPLLKPILEQLANSPRVYLAQHTASPSDIIVQSDLLISFPLTSPAIEAMSIKKKSIWYDPSEKYGQTFYDNVPGLICHGYKSLQQRVHQLLMNTTQSEFEEYLKNYVEKYCCQSMDGYALTRFRRLLTTGNPVAEESFINLPSEKFNY